MSSSVSVEPGERYGSDALAAVLVAGHDGALRLDALGLDALRRERGVDLAASRVAVRDGRLIGLALVARRGARGHLTDLAVVPQARGAGVATALLEEALEALAGDQVTRVDLEVEADNAAGLALYARVGFEKSTDLASYRATRIVARNLDVEEVPLASLRKHAPRDAPWPASFATAEKAHARGYRSEAGCATARPVAGGLVFFDVWGPDPGAVIDGVAALVPGASATLAHVRDPAVAAALTARGWRRYGRNVAMTKALEAVAKPSPLAAFD